MVKKKMTFVSKHQRTDGSEAESNRVKPDERMTASKFPFATMLAGAVSMSTLSLVLLGYGVALAIESAFALPHGSVVESSFDLVDLSALAVSQIVTRYSDSVLNSPVIWQLYGELWPLLIALFSSWFIFLAVRWVLKDWFVAQWRRHQLRRRNSGQDKRSSFGWLHHVLMGLLISTSPLLALLAGVFIVLPLVLLAVLPLLGHGAGLSYIKQWVIEPESCFVSGSRVDRLHRYQNPIPPDKRKAGVICVTVSKEGKELGRGREVYSTPKSMILFNPTTGKTVRVPIADAIIETVSSL